MTSDEDDVDNDMGDDEGANNNNNATATTTAHAFRNANLWYANGTLHTSFILIWVPVIDENDPSSSLRINEDFRPTETEWKRKNGAGAQSTAHAVIHVKKTLDFSNPLQVCARVCDLMLLPKLVNFIASQWLNTYKETLRTSCRHNFNNF